MNYKSLLVSEGNLEIAPNEGFEDIFTFDFCLCVYSDHLLRDFNSDILKTTTMTE